MALKRELEQQVADMTSEMKKLSEKLLLMTQVGETNKRLGDDVVRLEKELFITKQRMSINMSRLETRNNHNLSNANNLRKRLGELEKNYNISRKFIQSINKV